MVIELAFQGAFDHHRGQLAQQPALASEVQPADAGPPGELAQQLLAGRRQLGAVLALLVRHVCHWWIHTLRSYTLEFPVPPGFPAQA